MFLSVACLNGNNGLRGRIDKTMGQGLEAKSERCSIRKTFSSKAVHLKSNLTLRWSRLEVSPLFIPLFYRFVMFLNYQPVMRLEIG